MNNYSNLVTAPDWSWYLPDKTNVIPPDTIICTKNGEVVSRYGDDVWKLSQVGSVNFYFENWGGISFEDADNKELYLLLKEQIKSILFALRSERYLNYYNRVNKLNTSYIALKALGRIAYSCGIDLSAAPTSLEFQNALKISLFQLASDPTIKTSGHLSVNTAKEFLQSTLSDINLLSVRHPDYCLTIVSPEFLSEVIPVLNTIADEHKNDTDRTLLIPPRIYLEIISRLKNLCEDVESNKEAIIELSKNPYYARKSSSSRIDKEKAEKLLCESGLDKIFQKYCSYAPTQFHRNIWAMRKYLLLGIALYTGMRSQEVSFLDCNSLEKINVSGFGEINLINGATRKLQKARVPVGDTWATDLNGAKIFKTIVFLTRLIFETRYEDKEWNSDEVPLLLSTPNADGVGNSIHFPDYKVLNYKGLAREARKEGCLFDIKVTEEDIQSLHKFDAARDWSNDVKLGETWPLKWHQFRRALAVYASRSGIVSLPQMKTQLKHMSTVMTALYAENSIFAENIIADENGNVSQQKMGMVLDYRANESLSKTRTFNKALESTNRLSGPAGTKIQRLKDTKTIPHIFKSENELHNLVKQGVITAKETVLGICVKDGICSAHGIDEITPCGPKCPNHIGGIEGTQKLENYIESLESSVKKYPDGNKYAKELTYEIEQRKIELEEAYKNGA
ncbi:hypothetical protein [Marinobacterium sp. xm-v-233]|uniref:hypothetical protein n=1 Tax=Marinobacterium sp. xm-v-233 TaxID=2497744 RepID=UPI001567D861|nr:hypothetical protein [Marinobacterium sp. xm-v-233]NRQ00797.1 hypothetical protein [Marinobacterium sp. xm-v-233]